MLLPWRVIKYEVKFMVWNRRNSLSLSAVPSDHLGFQNSQTIRLKSGAKAAICGNYSDEPQGFPRKGRFAKHLSSAIGLIGYHLITCVYFVVLHFGQTYQ